VTQTRKKKWTIFTCVGKGTSYIINVFRQTDFKTAFHTNNTIRNLLSHTNPAPDKFSLLGVYKLTCPDCNKEYIEQTGRPFTTQYIEHKVAFRNTSSFAKHLNKEAHSFSPINMMHFLCSTKKKPT
jgi:hypothetical protein